jgi:hypothetical protein
MKNKRKAQKSTMQQLVEDQIALLETYLSGDDEPVQKSRKSSTRGAAQRSKHTLGTLASESLHRPMYEDAFFQDCALDSGLMNLLIQPQDSIVNRLPVRTNNNMEQKFGFLTAHGVFDTDGAEEPDTNCEPCLVVDDDYDFLKFSFPYGRICRRGKTLEVNELIRRACARQYQDFYFIGDLRGVPAFSPPWENAQADRDIVVQSAVNRQLWNIGRRLQLWMMEKVWTGDPDNNVNDQYKEFHGLLRLISDSYGTISSPITIEVMNTAARATALNSNIMDFDGNCVGGDVSLYEYMEEMELVLYHRARNLKVLPVEWGIYMNSFMWEEITKHLPCEMAGIGCSIPANSAANQVGIVLNSPGGDLFTLSMREKMRESMTITLNGRVYPIYTDDNLPYTYDDEANSYTGDILWIPFMAGGEEVLYIEHIDYSAIDQELGPLPGSFTDALGWTDSGKYHHAFTMERWCFEVQTKLEPRLIFKAPHLAGRIQDVCVTILSGSVRELWKGPTGALTGQLVKDPELAPNGGLVGA